MRLLFCGDVVGRSGRQVVIDHLPKLRERLKLDVVIVNGENAAGGFGITPIICRELYDAGADAITLGNHAFDQRDLIPYIDTDPRLVRAVNMLPETPGRGVTVLEDARGRKVALLQVMGRLFMGHYDDPFRALQAELARVSMPGLVAAVVVDLHAEASSEKMALGHLCDGRASLVVGTHTHVPTADAQVLPGGTAFIGDVGMCGDYDSVIGMDKTVSLARFRSHLPGPRNTPARGDATLCAVFVETDDDTGLARRIAPLRLGGRLAAAWPDAEEG